jgi:hypothetical protein
MDPSGGSAVDAGGDISKAGWWEEITAYTSSTTASPGCSKSVVRRCDV